MPNLVNHLVNCRIATIMNTHMPTFPYSQLLPLALFTAHFLICSVLPPFSCVGMGPAPIYQILPNTNQGARISFMPSVLGLLHWHNALQ